MLERSKAKNNLWRAKEASHRIKVADHVNLSLTKLHGYFRSGIRGYDFEDKWYKPSSRLKKQLIFEKKTNK